MDESTTGQGIELVEQPVTVDRLSRMAQEGFGDLVKAVVDIDKRIMAINGELHADEEAYLLERGSRQANLWGINLYPEEHGAPEFVEFDSMINLRPGEGNRSRSVDDPAVQEEIRRIVDQLVTADG